MDVHGTLYSTRGAVTAVATALNISVAAVSQWKKRRIPAGRVRQVEAALRAHIADIGAPAGNNVALAPSNNETVRDVTVAV